MLYPQFRCNRYTGVKEDLLRVFTIIILVSLPSWSCFVEISPPVLEKKIFEGFLPYMGMAAILVM